MFFEIANLSFRFLILIALALSFRAPGQILIKDEDPNLNVPRKDYIGESDSGASGRLDERMDWASYQSLMLEVEKRQMAEGYAYSISGGLVLIGALVGYTQAEATLEKSVFSVAQSLSVASIGYGVYRLQVGSQERSLYELIDSSPSLTDSQRLSFMRHYYQARAKQRETNKWIRFFTYMAIGGLNIYQATQETNDDVKLPLYAIGGASMLISLSIVF